MSLKYRNFLILLIPLLSAGIMSSCHNGKHDDKVIEVNNPIGMSMGEVMYFVRDCLGIKYLDTDKRFAMLIQDVGMDTIYRIFDMGKLEFVYNEDGYWAAYDIVRQTDNSYRLKVGLWSLNLILPADEMESAKVTPQFNDTIISADTYISLAKDAYLKEDRDLYENMRLKYPHAYSILGKINKMSWAVKDSPESDLSMAKAAGYFISKDSHYRGDFKTAMKDISQMIVVLDNDGRLDMSEYGRYVRLLSVISMAREYAGLLKINHRYKKEYIEWHNLMQAVTRYNDMIWHHWEQTYNQYHDDMLEQAECFYARTKLLTIEAGIMTGKTTDVNPVDSLKTAKDILKICESYHKNIPGRYHPMWNEVYYSFSNWLGARNDICESLPIHIRENYKVTTSVAINEIYKIIKSIHSRSID